ncbi:unnamed protein product [Triticum turgidum subsp. durum]|uniref:Uncharacterized protein n=1 Tax=Triticum turgidum subsp. durum TaxID=4567 RepID=A0A9R1AEH4_TRITD|nr:unnamed protein product [Triticum turgidum subsp. durum]
MGSWRPRMPGFGDEGGGGGGRGGGQGRGMGGRGRGGFGFYPQQGGRGGVGGGGGSYQPRGAAQQWRPAAPAPAQPHANGNGGPAATIAPELRQANTDDAAPAPPAPAPEALEAVAEHLELDDVTDQFDALSMSMGGDDSGSVTTGTGRELAVARAPIPRADSSCKFPHRPGSGRAGTRCLVKANHFLAELPDKDLHQYDVAITPETSRVSGRAVMGELVRLHRASYLGGRLPAYDGSKSMYTAGPLPFTSKEFHITVLEEDDGSGQERRERTFKVVIRYAARADLRRLEQYIAGRQAEAPQEALQVLDIVLRELPTARYAPYGRSFFSPDFGRRRSLGDGVESWRGFYQTIRPTQMGLSLNIDMSATSFFEPLPVLGFVGQLLNADIHSRALSDAERVKIKKALRGVKVEVTHRGNIRRKYRISGLTAQTTRELTFPVDQGGTVKSVVQYFQETYGFAIQHINLPCLTVGNQQRPNYLPMEVCKIVEGQRYSKRLNQGQIRALLEETCQRPHDRERDIVQMVNHNSYHDDPYAKEFGIKISERLASVEARILPAPRLKYSETGREKDCLPRVGQWNMMNKKMVNGARVRSWLCVNFARNVQESMATGFCRELARMCQASGMDFALEPVLPVIYVRPDQVERGLKARFHDAMTALGPQRKEIELLIGILPDNNGSLYGDLKRVCEIDLGLISQCCLTKQVFKMNKQILANLSLKINVKVGGRNTVLADALTRRIPLVTDKPTIIFGADVTHPHPGEDSSPSIAAVVASQDWPEVTKYAGLVSAQTHRQELIEDLYNVTHDPQRGTIHGGMVRELLISFKRTTGEKPERIIFYRDGVSEGQFYQVLLHELDAIRKACASLEANYQPLVTFVVVQKRHHTRLFAHNHNDQSTVDKSGNILPGTVIDSKICHPTEFDFFLCSHAGIKARAAPRITMSCGMRTTSLLMDCRPSPTTFAILTLGARARCLSSLQHTTLTWPPSAPASTWSRTAPTAAPSRARASPARRRPAAPAPPAPGSSGPSLRSRTA